MKAGAAHRERALLGALSVLSGLSLLAAPARMARVYGLPPREGLLRALGARDLFIGAALCRGPHAAGASLLRGLADTFDAGLIAAEGLRHARRARAAGLRASGAVLLATYAHLLHERLRTGASRAPPRPASRASSGARPARFVGAELLLHPLMIPLLQAHEGRASPEHEPQNSRRLPRRPRSAEAASFQCNPVFGPARMLPT